MGFIALRLFYELLIKLSRKQIIILLSFISTRHEGKIREENNFYVVYEISIDQQLNKMVGRRRRYSSRLLDRY